MKIHKFREKHEIFMEVAGNAENFQKCVKIRGNGWKWVRMGKISLKWAPKRCGHVWDCTKRFYINGFVQFPELHGFVWKMMKIRKFHQNHGISMKFNKNAEISINHAEIRDNG